MQMVQTFVKCFWCVFSTFIVNSAQVYCDRTLPELEARLSPSHLNGPVTTKTKFFSSLTTPSFQITTSLRLTPPFDAHSFIPSENGGSFITIARDPCRDTNQNLQDTLRGRSASRQGKPPKNSYSPENLAQLLTHLSNYPPRSFAIILFFNDASGLL
jgi:hypothetical protein